MIPYAIVAYVHDANIGWDHNNGSYLCTYHFRHSSAGWTPVPATPMEADTWYSAAATFDASTGIAGHS